MPTVEQIVIELAHERADMHLITAPEDPYVRELYLPLEPTSVDFKVLPQAIGKPTVKDVELFKEEFQRRINSKRKS